MMMKTRTDSSRYPTYQLLNDPVLNKIYTRLHYGDQNWISVMVGGTGSGKSGCAISVAINLDVNHKGQTRFYYKKDGKVILPKICFSAKEFIALVDSDLPKGSIIIWDEAGVENDNTEWNSAKSRLIKHVMQTFRYKNWGLILTVPDLDSIAIGTRRLLHTKIIVEETGAGKFPRDKVRLAKVYWHKKNHITGESRWIRDVYMDPKQKNRYNKIVTYAIPKPPQEVYDAYNEKKKEQLEKWYNGMGDEIDAIYEKIGISKEEAKVNYSFEEGLKYVMSHMREFYDPVTKRFNKDAISMDLHWKNTQAEKLASILNLKLRQGLIDINAEPEDIKSKKKKDIGYELKSNFLDVDFDDDSQIDIDNNEKNKLYE